MGQSGSSELRISQEADAATFASGSSSSDPSVSSPAAAQLRWLRASRAGRGSLMAEWRWFQDVEPTGRCHLLFLRSDAPRPGQAGRMRRVPVKPLLPGYTMTGLAEDAPYRVCLQCAATAAATMSEAGQNRTSAKPVAGRPSEIMHCVNVSTKQAHLPAIIGSSLGALCALILVLALVLLSRRSKQYRKVTERQTSATAKKVLVQEISYKTEHLPPTKLDLDSNSDGYIYDGSEEQQVSSASDDVLTPPPQPPPPPPTMESPPDEAAPAAKELAAESESSAGKPELESLLSGGDCQPPDASADPEEAAVPPTPPPPPPSGPSMDVEAAVDTSSTPISTSTDGRQVIQVNETDEYSIDLRLCDSLSRQQSLKMSASATTSSATSASIIASASGSASVAEQPDDSTATPTRQSSDNQPQQAEQRGQSVGAAVPSLYTQLIETL
ncbi:hypothetical protein BOX15_Mlig027554g1 [Macrostomum lignano]|uniref:Fibronectin type-III domain-containing protein n=1 Tax=Macrostomum lignano TaxID=282301 RepID=A0A267FUG7_9PLAT|nr:hypothetical protein BOX15_Mlig027554g1 [Macrostomum lignano]